MIVHQTVVFRADVVPQRKRKPAKGWSKRETAFSVPEATSSQAPVVLRALADVRRPRGLKNPVRVFDGRFYAPFGRGMDAAEALAQGIWSIHQTGCPPAVTLRQSTLRLADRPTQRSPDIIEGTVAGSAYDETAERIRRRVEEYLLLVDGVPHRRVLSPLVSLNDIARGFVGSAKAVVDAMSGRSFSVWFGDPAAVRAAFEELAKRGVNVRSEADRVLAALDVDFVDPAPIAALGGHHVALTDFSPLVEEATQRWRGERPRTPWGVDPQRGDTQNDIRERFLGWEAVRAALDGGADLDAIRKSISNPAPAVRPTQASAPDPERAEEGFTVMRVTEDFRIPYLRKFAQIRGHRPSDMPTEVEVPRAAPHQAVRALMLDELEVEVWISEGRFLAVDPLDRPVLRDGTDELPLPAPVAELSALNNIHSFTSPGSSVLEHARNHLVDLDGRVGHVCSEPVVVVRPDGKRPSVSLDWRWHEARETTSDLPFVFGLDDLDGAARFMDAVGLPSADFMPSVRVVSADPALVGRRPLLWNLRVSTTAVLEGLDARAGMLSTEAFAAAGRLAEMLEGWRSLRRWDGEKEDAELRDLAAVLVAEIGNPFFQDVVHPAVLDVAFSSLAKLNGKDQAPAPDDEQNYALFAI